MHTLFQTPAPHLYPCGNTRISLWHIRLESLKLFLRREFLATKSSFMLEFGARSHNIFSKGKRNESVIGSSKRINLNTRRSQTGSTISVRREGPAAPVPKCFPCLPAENWTDGGQNIQVLGTRPLLDNQRLFNASYPLRLYQKKSARRKWGENVTMRSIRWGGQDSVSGVMERERRGQMIQRKASLANFVWCLPGSRKQPVQKWLWLKGWNKLFQPINNTELRE